MAEIQGVPPQPQSAFAFVQVFPAGFAVDETKRLSVCTSKVGHTVPANTLPKARPRETRPLLHIELFQQQFATQGDGGKDHAASFINNLAFPKLWAHSELRNRVCLLRGDRLPGSGAKSTSSTISGYVYCDRIAIGISADYSDTPINPQQLVTGSQMRTVVCADKTIDVLADANLLLQGRSLRGVRLHAFPSLGLCSVKQRTFKLREDITVQDLHCPAFPKSLAISV